MARASLCIALLVYCLGIGVFAYFPSGTLDWPEAVCLVLSVLAGIGLVAHMLPAVTLPGEQYAYLVTGFTGFTTMLLFLLDIHGQQGITHDFQRVVITLFLLAGAIAAYGAFLSEAE